MQTEVIKVPEWKELIEVAKDWEYGTVHSHDEIAQIIGLQEGEHRYYCTIGITKRKLLEQEGKLLKSISGKGYQILPADENVDETLNCYDQGRRRIVKGFKILTFSRQDKMTEEGRNRYRIVADRAMQINAHVIGGCTELKLLARPQLIIRSGKS